MEEEILEEVQNPNNEATEADSENLEQDDSDTYESEDDSTEEQEESVSKKVEQKPINKTAEKFKKVLDKNKEYRERLEAIEKELAIEKLSKTYGEIDGDAVAQIKKENKTLSWEDCVILYNAKKPKVTTKTTTSNFVGRESAGGKKTFVTDADLKQALRDGTYDHIMAQIDSGKLIHKK